MLRIIDASAQVDGLFPGGRFDQARWEDYINAIYPGSVPMFREEMDACLAGGVFTFEENFLPVIQNVYQNPELDRLRASFSAVTEGLEERIQRQFGQGLDADLTLYLGLCHGAGWVVKLAGRDVVLLGIEKILELNWQSREAMTGLVYHELGHVYHRRYGALDQGAEDGPEGFVWQLFTEGVAMCFEQDLVGDSRWFHQDSSGWLAWCEAHFSEILADFDGDLPAMTRRNQRYFGDWCDYHGWRDVGYYLGARFVRRLLERFSFQALIALPPERVCALYREFAGQYAGT